MHSLRIFLFRPIHQTKTRFISTQFKGTPFKLTYDEAYKSFENSKSIWDEQTPPTTQLIEKPINTFTPRFIPFHSAEIHGLNTSFSGKYGIDHSEVTWQPTLSKDGKLKMQPQTRVWTKWYNMSGVLNSTDYTFGHNKLQVYAGFKYPRTHVEKIMAIKYKQGIKQLNEKEIDKIPGSNHKIAFDEPEMNMAYAIEKIVDELNTFEKERVIDYVKQTWSADRVDIQSVNIHLDQARMELMSYYLPAYVYTYEVDSKLIHTFVNGYSGDVIGTHLYSPSRVFAGTSLIGIGLSLLTLTHPMGWTGLALRSVLFGVISGALGAGWTRLNNYYKVKNYTSNIEKESSYNQMFEETYEDLKRRDDVHHFNGDISSHNFDNIMIDSSKFTILGLDQSKAKQYTYKDIQEAYHKEIKKWHPDHYTGNKDFGHHMSVQINEAYTLMKSKYCRKIEIDNA